MNILALTCAEFADELERRYGRWRCHAPALYRAVFQKGKPDLAGTSDPVRRITADMRLPQIRILERLSEGGITKFVSILADNERIESVIIRAEGRTTLCVSSQVGCRMACRFCATGRMGFRRNLSAEEIVWQVHAARFGLRRRIDNVVFMGMGEPLDNLANVIRSIRVISDQRGFDIACRHITVSTAGHADGIRELVAEGLPNLRLAVSLNSADDGQRSQLMPINRAYPLSRLKAALQDAARITRGVIFIEYILLAGVNDTRADAIRLARYLDGLPVRINIIAYNPGRSPVYTPPDHAQVLRFARGLAADKLFVRIRPSRGQGIMAACGQLGAEY